MYYDTDVQFVITYNKINYSQHIHTTGQYFHSLYLIQFSIKDLNQMPVMHIKNYLAFQLFDWAYPMTVILETRRAHQNITTYLFSSIYFEYIVVPIRLDGLLALKGFLNYLIFQSFDYEITWWRLFRKSVVCIKFHFKHISFINKLNGLDCIQ